MGCPAWDFLAEKYKNRMRNKYIWIGWAVLVFCKTMVVISLQIVQNLIGRDRFQNIFYDGIVINKNETALNDKPIWKI